MRTRFVVLLHPNIEIGLQLVDGPINFLAERHAIELVEYGSMEALADSIGLWALGLGAGVIDVLDGEIELVVVMLGVTAILRAAIGQHPAQHNAVLLEERQHPIVQNLRRGDWRLAVIELGEGHLGVGIDEGLLIDVATPFMLLT